MHSALLLSVPLAPQPPGSFARSNSIQSTHGTVLPFQLLPECFSGHLASPEDPTGAFWHLLDCTIKLAFLSGLKPAERLQHATNQCINSQHIH